MQLCVLTFKNIAITLIYLVFDWLQIYGVSLPIAEILLAESILLNVSMALISRRNHHLKS